MQLWHHQFILSINVHKSSSRDDGEKKWFGRVSEAVREGNSVEKTEYTLRGKGSTWSNLVEMEGAWVWMWER